jgi:hypothetical protein
MSSLENRKKELSSSVVTEHLFRDNQNSARANWFGIFVRARWPYKPALNLSQRMGCTERAALYLINGQRKVTAKAALVMFTVMLEGQDE